MTKILVYGTLKKGFGNNTLLSNSEFVTKGVIKGEMYSLGGFPAITEGDNNILGEVYEVNDSTLDSIDGLEGHPNWYKREIVIVITDEGKTKAWVYFMKKTEINQKQVVKSGVWI